MLLNLERNSRDRKKIQQRMKINCRCSNAVHRKREEGRGDSLDGEMEVFIRHSVTCGRQLRMSRPILGHLDGIKSCQPETTGRESDDDICKRLRRIIGGAVGDQGRRGDFRGGCCQAQTPAGPGWRFGSTALELIEADANGSRALKES